MTVLCVYTAASDVSKRMLAHLIYLQSADPSTVKAGNAVCQATQLGGLFRYMMYQLTATNI